MGLSRYGYHLSSFRLQWPQDWKKSVFIPIPKKGNAKECSNYHTTAFISHASKVILQARLQQHVNNEFPGVQLDLEKAEEPEVKFPTSVSHQKSKRVPEKHLLLLYWLCQSLWLCGSQQTGKFLKRYQTTWPASWETCMPVRKQQLELDMEQQTGSK